MTKKSCYFQVVKPDETLIVVLQGSPPADVFETVKREFGRKAGEKIIICSDGFKFIVVPKGTEIKVENEVKENAK